MNLLVCLVEVVLQRHSEIVSGKVICMNNIIIKAFIFMWFGIATDTWARVMTSLMSDDDLKRTGQMTMLAGFW